MLSFSIQYQSVKLDFDGLNKNIKASTKMWLYSSDDISPGSKLLLNYRGGFIEKVIVNEQPCTYVYNDPFRGISSSQKLNCSPSYSSEEIDLNFRSAFTLSRFGELEISLPPMVGKNNDIPVSAKNSDTSSSENNDNAFGHYLFIRMEYNIPLVNSSAICVLRPTPLVDKSNMNAHNSSKIDNLQCMYTSRKAGQYKQQLYDVDGVRCWLPCIDSPNQRHVFDITLMNIPKEFDCVCSGMRISKTISSTPPIPSDMYNYRFVTNNHTTPTSIGWFIGKVERYGMPLYQCYGRFWVVRQPEVCPNKHKECADMKASVGICDREDKCSTKAPVIVVDVDEDGYTSGDSGDDWVDGSLIDRNRGDKGTIPHQLFKDDLSHTTLGLDLGLRYIHKFVSKAFGYKNYTQIFVPLLCGDSISFDGFSLINSQFLHSTKQIHMETPSHLIQISSFVTSWFLTSFPIESYMYEFLINGAVNYVVNVYAEYLYGEEMGKYRFLKMYDSVVQLERSGRGFPLVSIYQESYEKYLACYMEYCACKATVLYHLIEHRIGTRDPIRLALRQIIQTPPIEVLSVASKPQRMAGRTQRSQQSLQFPNQCPNPSPHNTGSFPPPTPYGTNNFAPPSQHGAGSFPPPTPYGTNNFAPPSQHGAGSFPPPTPYGGTNNFAPPPQQGAGNFPPPTPYGTNNMPPPPSFSGAGNFPPPTPYGTNNMPPPTPLQDGMPPPSPHKMLTSVTPTAIPSDKWSHQMPPPVAPLMRASSGSASARAALQPPSASPRSAPPAAVSSTTASAMPPPKMFPTHTGPGTPRTTSSSTTTHTTNQATPSSSDEDGIDNDSTIHFVNANQFLSIVQAHGGLNILDLNDDFIDRMMLDNESVLFLRCNYELKSKASDPKSKMLTIGMEAVSSDNRCHNNNANDMFINKLLSQKEEFRFRIVEGTDSNVTEGSVLVGRQKKESYTQHIHIRGKRGPHTGKRTGKDADGNDKGKTKTIGTMEPPKPPVPVANAIKTVLFDPHYTRLLDVYCATCPDAVIFEQINGSFAMELDSLYHIRGLRVLANSSVNRALLLGNVSADSTTSSLSINNQHTRARNQLKVFVETIMGSGSKIQHDLYVRAEAAHCLALWQMERSPANYKTNTVNDSTGSSEAGWDGMQALINCICSLFIDESAGVPATNDMLNEPSLYLCHALLMALSTVQTYVDCITPIKVTKTLLYFVENISSCCEFSSRNFDEYGGGNNIDLNEKDKKNLFVPTLVCYDNSYHRAILLYCLSRVRFHSSAFVFLSGNNNTNGGDTSVDMSEEAMLCSKVKDIATYELHKDITSAYTEYNLGNVPYISLSMGGIVAACAMTCLSQIDINFILSKSSYANSDDSFRKCMKTSTASISTVSCFPASVDYGKYFGLYKLCQTSELLRYHYSQFITFQRDQSDLLNAIVNGRSETGVSSGGDTVLDVASSSILLQSTALEAFVRICFAKFIHDMKLYGTKKHRSGSIGQGSSQGLYNTSSNQQNEQLRHGSTPVDPYSLANMHIATAITVVCAIISSPLYAVQFKRNAASILLDALQDKEPMMAASGLSFGEYTYANGWSDVKALTLPERKRAHYYTPKSPPPSSFSSSAGAIQEYRTTLNKCKGKAMKTSVKVLWNIITTSSMDNTQTNPMLYDQTLRSILLSVWVFAFGNKIPKHLTKDENISKYVNSNITNAATPPMEQQQQQQQQGSEVQDMSPDIFTTHNVSDLINNHTKLLHMNKTDGLKVTPQLEIQEKMTKVLRYGSIAEVGGKPPIGGRGVSIPSPRQQPAASPRETISSSSSVLSPRVNSTGSTTPSLRLSLSSLIRQSSSDMKQLQQQQPHTNTTSTSSNSSNSSSLESPAKKLKLTLKL